MFPLGSFLGVVFTIFLFMYRQHGRVNHSLRGYWGIYLVELNGLIIHLFPLNVIVLKFDIFLL